MWFDGPAASDGSRRPDDKSSRATLRFPDRPQQRPATDEETARSSRNEPLKKVTNSRQHFELVSASNATLDQMDTLDLGKFAMHSF